MPSCMSTCVPVSDGAACGLLLGRRWSGTQCATGRACQSSFVHTCESRRVLIQFVCADIAAEYSAPQSVQASCTADSAASGQFPSPQKAIVQALEPQVYSSCLRWSVGLVGTGLQCRLDMIGVVCRLIRLAASNVPED